mgnify:CR=1 FL=1
MNLNLNFKKISETIVNFDCRRDNFTFDQNMDFRPKFRLTRTWHFDVSVF